MNTAAQIINSLSTTGLEYYAASQGQPISTTNVGGISSVTTGSIFSGTSGTFLIALIIIAAVVLIAVVKK